MNSLMARIVLTSLLLTLGALCWRAGRIEGRMAEADRDLATLESMRIDAYDAIEGSIGPADRLTRSVLGRSNDAARQRATVQYWLAEFATLRPERDTDGNLVNDDPERLFVGANAAYRATIWAGDDGETVAERLEGVLEAYADVLRVDATHVDAAYNYEYVARLRAALSAGRRPPNARLDAVQAGADPGGQPRSNLAAQGQLPDGPTLHGWPGAPPRDMTVDQFRVYVPLRPTEREESNDAGKGPQKARKG